MRTLALVALVGCYRESRPPPKPPEPQPLVVEQPKHARTAQDPLGFLPIDAELVAHVDAVQLRRSAIWARLEPEVFAKVGPTLDRFRVACGFDPVPMIRRVAMGMKNVDAQHPDAVIVVRGIEREPTMRCLVQTLGRDPKVLTMEGGIVVVPPATANDTSLAMAFADSSTLVFLSGPLATKQQMRAVLESGSPLRNSPKFVEMFGMIDSTRAAWFLVNGNAGFMKNGRAFGLNARGLFGSVDLATGLAAKMRLRSDTPAEAQGFVSMAQGQLGAAKNFVERIEVTSEEADVVMEVVMTDDQANLLINLVNP